MTSTADEGISVQAGQKRKRGRPRGGGLVTEIAREWGMGRQAVYRANIAIRLLGNDRDLRAAIEGTPVYNNKAAIQRIFSADDKWSQLKIELERRRKPHPMRGVPKKALIAERRILAERLDRDDFADTAAREEGARRHDEITMTLVPQLRREWNAPDLAKTLGEEIIDDETLLKIASMLETCDPKQVAAELRRTIEAADKPTEHRNLLSELKGELATLSYDELVIVDDAIGVALQDYAVAEQPPAVAAGVAA